MFKKLIFKASVNDVTIEVSAPEDGNLQNNLRDMQVVLDLIKADIKKEQENPQ